MGSSRLGAAALVLAALVAACTSPASDRPADVSSPAVSPTVTKLHRGESRVAIFHATHFDGAWALAHGPDFAKRAGLMNRLRSSLPNSRNTLLVGNGDDIDPGAGRATITDNRFTLDHGPDTAGMHAVEAFNAVGLDATTYGFNELDWIDRLAPQLPKARFAMVSANVRDRATGQVFGAQHGALLWVMKEVAGVRFAITGALTGEGPPPRVPTVEVIEPAQALAEVVPRMRAAGADVVIVLSHLDTYTEAQRIAEAVAGIDLILGTHNGDPLPAPQRINGTLLSVPPWLVDNFGRLDLTIRDGRITGAVLHQYKVAANEPPDPAVQRILDRYLPAP